LLFVQVADEDDNNIIETVILRRRQDILRQLLQRQRLILHRIHANRTIYYTAYVGTWFETYPEIQFNDPIQILSMPQNLKYDNH
jgi:hypothetical protein